MRYGWLGTGMVGIGALSGCLVGEIHHGDGVAAEEVREVEAFTEVAAESSLDVAVSLGAPSVTVRCDQNLLVDILTEVDDGVLEIRTRDEQGQWVVLAPEVPCGVIVSAPTLTRVANTGSGTMVVGGAPIALEAATNTGSGDLRVEADVVCASFDVSATGSGDVEVGAVDVDALDARVTGSGSMSFGDGTADALTALVSGSGSLDAAGVVAARVEATVTGSGGAEVTATDAIVGQVTGSGDLVVHGDPEERDTASMGSGEVRFE